jgi:hypothetical protein
LDSLGYDSVFSEQINGQWCVDVPLEYLSMADRNTLRRLGYQMALTKWGSNQYVKI